MSIENFFSTQIVNLGAPANGGARNNASISMQGLDFVNIILTRMLEAKNADTTIMPVKTSEYTPLESTNPLLDKTPSLNLAELLAATPEIRQEVENFITTPAANLSPEEQILQTLALNQKALGETLSTEPQTAATGELTLNVSLPPLTGEITTAENTKPEDGQTSLLNAMLIDTEKDRKVVLNKLGLILNKLEKLTQDKTGGGLSITNLTPEQITGLKNKIANLLEKTEKQGGELSTDKTEDDAEIAGIVLGLIKILPPQARPEVIVMPQGLVITPRQLTAQTNNLQNAASKPANDHMSSMNPLLASGEPTSEDQSLIPFTGKDEENFNELLKQFTGNNKKQDMTLNLVTGKPDMPQHNLPTIKPDFSALQNWPLAADGTVLTAYDPSQSVTPIAATSITGLETLTNLVTHAPSAGSSHPAIQMIAATIQKSSNDGTNKSITLQLDPPELGRLEIKMSFGKDKAIKAILTAERPETLALLQRDAHTLERTLSNMGLDANGGLSFELANDNHFNNNGGHDGSNGGSNNEGESADPDLIESAMTWHVDPETGRMRYNALV